MSQAIAQVLFVSMTLSLKICISSTGKKIVVISVGAKHDLFLGEINKTRAHLLT